MGIKSALKLLSVRLSDVICSLDSIEDIDEIRLRLGRCLSVVKSGRIYLLNATVCTDDIEYTFKSAFSYSLHCYSKELANGYITTEDGNRVGLCGTAVIPAQSLYEVESVKYISSINIRISRQVEGYGKELFNMCLRESPNGILVVGPPSCGKTTLLRDISRLSGEYYKVALVDEMNEISYSYKGVPQMNVGRNTDIFVGYPKHIGIRTAVKVMSPHIIICDEIGEEYDIKALQYALHSGVKIVTAVHGLAIKETLNKRYIKELVQDNAFRFAAYIYPDSHEYEVIRID